MSEKKRKVIEYRPAFAKLPGATQGHVLGTYEEREFDPETGTFEPQLVVVVCEKCGLRWQKQCDSGMVRQHVVRFAAQHTHADPLRPVIPRGRQ